MKCFVKVCHDNALKNVSFVLDDALNKVENLTSNELDNCLLKKERFWNGFLLTQHHGLSETHNCNSRES